MRKPRPSERISPKIAYWMLPSGLGLIETALEGERLQAAALDQAAQRVAVEVLEVPRQVELEPGRAEEAPVPAAEIGHRNGQQPTGPQQPRCLGHGLGRLVDVLERVVEDDRVEVAVLPGGVGEGAVDRVDAGFAGELRRLLGRLDPRGLPAVAHEDGGEVAGAAADVEQAAGWRSSSLR